MCVVWDVLLSVRCVSSVVGCGLLLGCCVVFVVCVLIVGCCGLLFGGCWLLLLRAFVLFG